MDTSRTSSELIAMSNPRHSYRASGLWSTLKRMARSSNDPLVGDLPQQMTSHRSSDIQCTERAMADARFSDIQYTEHDMADARFSDIQFTELAMADARFSDVLHTGEATTARFSNHQTADLSKQGRFSDIQVSGCRHGNLVLTSPEPENRVSYSLQHNLQQQRFPISVGPDASPLRSAMESHQFESHSAEKDTASEALALREILEALEEVCSVGIMAWQALQLLTPIGAPCALWVDAAYLESRDDLQTSVAYLSVHGLCVASEPLIWTVANEFFRICDEIDDLLKLRPQSVKPMAPLVYALEKLNKAVSRAKRLIEMSPWKRAATTFKFDKNIQASKDYHDESTQSDGVFPIKIVRQDTSETTLVQLSQALMDQCYSIDASLSLFIESVSHQHSDRPMESTPHNTILTIASDCDDMISTCTALRTCLSLHGNEEALSRCSDLRILCRSLRSRLQIWVRKRYIAPVVSDDLSEACAILKDIGTLAGGIGKMMD